MSEPNILAVKKTDQWGCCYNERGEHEGSFEPMPLSNDEIIFLFTEYVAEKLPALVDKESNGTTYTITIVLFRDVAGRLQGTGLQLVEISNSIHEDFELRTEITGLIYC
jgi:hypothetical protein